MSSERAFRPQALIVGLGNPGTEYASHRHNIGFRVVDALARAHGLRFVRQKDARARVATGSICGWHSIVGKPQTFMNLSGRTVSRLCRQYDMRPEQILIVYDDLDLPLGRLRLRQEGGSGGHKGMVSIISQLGTQGFPRLRIGVGRPPGRMEPADYVLQPFTKEEEAIVAGIVETAVEAIESWVTEGIVVAMDRFNRPLPIGEGESAEPASPPDREPCQEAREGTQPVASDETGLERKEG